MLMKLTTDDVPTDDILPGHKTKKGQLDIWINFLDNEEMVWYRGYKLAEGISNTGSADFSIKMDQLPEEILKHPTSISVEPTDVDEEDTDEDYFLEPKTKIPNTHKITKEDQKRMEQRIDKSKFKPWMKTATKLALRTLLRLAGPAGWAVDGAFMGFGRKT